MWRLMPAILLPLAFGAQYPFSATLSKDSFDQPIYQLQWTFDVVQQTITFNVLVKTTGWVGFGLSPDGGMVGSDVVTGWVNDTGAYLQVSCKPTGGGGGRKIYSLANFHFIRARVYRIDTHSLRHCHPSIQARTGLCCRVTRRTV